jgi:trans-aconitate methyltransferase
MNPGPEFFLPLDYIENPVTSLDESPSESYWGDQRVAAASRFQKPFYNWVLKEITNRRPLRIADVGCGTGGKIAEISEQFPASEYFGFDQPSSLKLQRKSSSVSFLPVNLDQHSSWEGEKFDFVISSDTIEHLGNPGHLLNFLKSLCSKNAVCMISTPDRDALRGKRNRRSPNPAHVREWNKSELFSYLETSGFQVASHRNLLPKSLRLDLQTGIWALKRALTSPRFHTNQGVLSIVNS